MGKGNHTLRGPVSFGQYLCYSISLPRLIQPPKGYPVSPVTIGEHLRKKRLDLGLTQEAAGQLLGVTCSTVWNWEHGQPPRSKHHLRWSRKKLRNKWSCKSIRRPKDPENGSNVLHDILQLIFDNANKT